jgi:hypothetical protein
VTVQYAPPDAGATWRGGGDRVDKPAGYAAAGIPVHLLIDRDEGALVVHSKPERGKYQSLRAWAYGDVVEFPDPVGITLETEELKQYAS